LAQKVTKDDGSFDYADPSMLLVALPATSDSKAALAAADIDGRRSMDLTCDDVVDEGTITPMNDKCYKLIFHADKNTTTFKVDATGTAAIVFFAQHHPTEFENTAESWGAHYLKLVDEDIEPTEQYPPADGHSHGPGGVVATSPSDVDEFGSKCPCQAAAQGWTIDCSNTAKMVEASDYMELASNNCAQENPAEECTKNYHIIQAHHDHCLHDQLPIGLEKKLHAWEAYYTDCKIKRQYNPALGACPQAKCDSYTTLQDITAKLFIDGCDNKAICDSSAECKAGIKDVLIAHDDCPESKLPNFLEMALHDHEDSCADHLCNHPTTKAVFNPFDEPCSAEASDASDASGFRSPAALLVITSAVPLAVFFSL
jgi:hypothetical protein